MLPPARERSSPWVSISATATSRCAFLTKPVRSSRRRALPPSRRRSAPQNRRRSACGLVARRASSMTSPASSRTHTWMWRSPRSRPTVTFVPSLVVASLMGQPPSLGPQSPALLGDLTVPRGRLAFSSHLDRSSSKAAVDGLAGEAHGYEAAQHDQLEGRAAAHLDQDRDESAHAAGQP